MGFLAVIPARGGSKGLRRKNLRQIMGLSLTARAVRIARAIHEIDFILLSTDCPEIASEGLKHGALVPFMRPKELSQDDTPMVAVLEHAVNWFRKEMPLAAECCEGLVLLQPTSPMRNVGHIQKAIRLFVRRQKEGNPADCVHCVSPVPDLFRPDKLLRMTPNGILMKNIFDASTGRTVYRNGAAVILNMDNIDALTVSGRTVGVVIEENLVSIDTYEDFKTAAHQMSSVSPAGNRSSQIS